MAALLLGATVFRGLILFHDSDSSARTAWRSLATWWVLFLLLVASLLLGRQAVALLMLATALLGLREALFLIFSRGLFAVVAFLFLLVFLWGWLDRVILFTRAIPLLLLILATGELARQLLLPERFREVKWVILGLLVSLLGPLFVLGAAFLPVPRPPGGSWQGWLVALVILTELNDMAQAWWGRALGSRPLAPSVSPTKTWEGFAGGMVTTVAVALFLAPLLTPFGRMTPPGGFGPPWLWSLALGILVSLAGVAGDLTASALKRRRGVKDSGNLLPAQGGILDRFDSLAVSAPAFFFFAWLLWARPL